CRRRAVVINTTDRPCSSAASEVLNPQIAQILSFQFGDASFLETPFRPPHHHRSCAVAMPFARNIMLILSLPRLSSGYQFSLLQPVATLSLKLSITAASIRD